MNVDIQMYLSQKSDRVKCIDFHPSEPWVLMCLFSGKAIVFDIEKKEIRNHFEPGYQPIRCGKFIARKQWVVFGCDDMNLRIYNYNTGEKIKQWRAHDDFIRGIDVHESLPYILTCSDDMLIKLWNWENGFELVRKYDGHTYFIMAVKFNPKDSTSFASASLDRSIKIWSISKSRCNYSLMGHQKGINCIDFYAGADRPYIISGSDDQTVKVWDYQTKTCIQTLTGHEDNVTCVMYHPRLPYIISGGEDNRIIIYHSGNYRRERVIVQPTLDRVWSLSVSNTSNFITIGYDEGYCVYCVGKNTPACSMDANGKVVWSVRQDVKLGVIDAAMLGKKVIKGDEVTTMTKDISFHDTGNWVTPTLLLHNDNGRFLAVIGEGEYMIYTSRQLRNKAFGEGLDFVWKQGDNDYCVQINESTLKLYSDFKEVNTIQLTSRVSGLYSGCCLGVYCNNEFVAFYDWVTTKLVCRIDTQVTGIHWNAKGTLLAIQTPTSTFLLKYHEDLVHANLGSAGTNGVENSFEVIQEFSNGSNSGEGAWYNDAFIYICNNRLRIVINDYVEELNYVNKQMHILKYVSSMNTVFLMDSKNTVYGYTIDSMLLDYECCIAEQDFEKANSLLSSISPSFYNQLAKYLDHYNYTDIAIQIASDDELKFDLALKMGNTKMCMQLLTTSLKSLDRTNAYNPQRWRRLADLCISQARIDYALKCAQYADDLSLSLLLLSCIGDKSGLDQLATSARQEDQFNVAFLAYYSMGDTGKCIELLQECGKLPEAAFFSLAYAPSKSSSLLQMWKEELRKKNHIATELLADPMKYADFFPGFNDSIRMEEDLSMLLKMNVRASDYSLYKEMLKKRGLSISLLHSVNEVIPEKEKEESEEEKELEQLENEEITESADLDIEDLERQLNE